MDLFHVWRTVIVSGRSFWKYSVWLLLLYIPLGCSMRCYTCSTERPDDPCAANPESLTQKQNCQGTQICVKNEMYFPNGTFWNLYRGCIEIPDAMASGCRKGASEEEKLDLVANYGKNVDKDKQFRVCPYFCSEDLCNAGLRLPPVDRESVTFFLLLSLLFSAFIV